MTCDAHPPLTVHETRHWCTPGCAPGCDVRAVRVWHAEEVIERSEPFSARDIEDVRLRLAQSRDMTSAEVVDRQKRERRARAEAAARRIAGQS